MADNYSLIPLHPQGEDSETTLSTVFATSLGEADAATGELQVQTPGGKVFVDWDAQAPLTPIRQLVFFSQFLKITMSARLELSRPKVIGYSTRIRESGYL